MGSDQYGDIAYNRGVGAFLNHARNQLRANVINFYHKGDFNQGNQKTSWGIKVQDEQVRNTIKEWNYLDSARFNTPREADSIGYQDPSNIPYQELHLSKFIKAQIKSLDPNSEHYDEKLQKILSFRTRAI